MSRRGGFRVTAFLCGSHTIPAPIMLSSLTGDIRIEIPAIVVEHPSGLFVFDTGFSSLVHRDPTGYHPPAIAGGKLFHFTAADELARQMAALSLDPADVRYVANSHLHYDHCGGNADFPQAELLIQAAEWQAAMAAPEDSSGYRRVDYVDSGQSLILIDGEHDVFGDGSVMLVPTPGHTAGHQSLRLRAAGRDLVFAADACYMLDTLLSGTLPAYPAPDQERYLASLARLRQMSDDGATVFPGHDPAFWHEQPQAPERLLEVEEF